MNDRLSIHRNLHAKMSERGHASGHAMRNILCVLATMAGVLLASDGGAQELNFDKLARLCESLDPDIGLPACNALIEARSIPNDSLALAYHHRGIIYRFRRAFERAIRDYEQAIKLDPKNSDSFAELGAAYHDMKDYDRAFQYYDQALGIDPKNLGGLMSRASAYRDVGEYDRAIADFDSAVAVDPNIADAFLFRGNAYRAKGEIMLSIMDYDEAIRLAPDDPRIYNSRGNAYTDLDPARALADYNEAIRLDPDYREAYFNRGLSYAIYNDYARAIPDYDQAIRLDPNNANFLYYRGMLKFFVGRFEDATGDFSRSVDIDHKMLEAFVWLLVARGRAGHRDPANLSRDIGVFDLQKWPGPLIAFYLGRTKAQDVLAAAATGEPETQNIQRCTATFFLGEHELLYGTKNAAKQLLQEVKVLCPIRSAQYRAADIDLAGMLR